MDNPIQTGLITTTGFATNPDQIYIWNASPTAPNPNTPGETPGALTVFVQYGPNGSTDYSAVASIPWNSTAQVPVTVSPPSNPAPIGNVQAIWGDYDATSGNYQSYVVTFSGGMIYDTVNNCSSADQSKTGNTEQIIVCAFLTGVTAGTNP